MNLIPQPQSLTLKSDNAFSLLDLFAISTDFLAGESLRHALKILQKEIEELTAQSVYLLINKKVPQQSIVLSLNDSLANEEYRLEISINTIELEGSEAGLFFAVQTLRQIIRVNALKVPTCVIEDKPDYEERGFYHDVTRGKVAKVETLKKLIDELALYKINQLQLYVEHAFHFSQHPDLSAGSDALSSEDLMELDSYCALNNIDFIPSLSTFGHFYMGLRTPRKEHLNELDVETESLHFSFWDRQAHYTLDCQHEESLQLVEDIITEYSGLFRSKYFNICCDETFDLGKGKNKELADKEGTGQLYLDFLNKIIAIVEKLGKTPMLWGDVIVHHPEISKDLTKDAVYMHWDYSSDLRWGGDNEIFHERELPYYVVPGTRAWNHFLPHYEEAFGNNLAMGKKGKELSAFGYLNTDWGDYGHINSLSASLMAMAYGAQASWSLEKSDIDEFLESYSKIYFRDSSGDLAKKIYQLSQKSLISWVPFSQWLDPSQNPRFLDQERDERTGMLTQHLKYSADEYLQAANDIRDLRESILAGFSLCALNGATAQKEFALSCEGEELLQLVQYHLIKLSKKEENLEEILAFTQRLRTFERRFSETWHLANRPSEYWRVKEVLLKGADKLDRLALGS